jgi:hypothetical protein
MNDAQGAQESVIEAGIDEHDDSVAHRLSDVMPWSRISSKTLEWRQRGGQIEQIQHASLRMFQFENKIILIVCTSDAYQGCSSICLIHSS